MTGQVQGTRHGAPAPSPVRMADLSPQQAARLDGLMDAALDLPREERGAWLAALAAEEPLLARVLEGLLRAADAAQAGAERGAPETASLIARRMARAAAPPATLEGRRFGPWRVLRLLGRGGMGSVWLARRDDGLFEREVALKLVHASLFGPMLHERFARERRILAALAHPNIAGLLDAGVAEDGQPYLALEYVDGLPLDAWCDVQRVPLAGRLALMRQVLQAVQHAHQNLVIHRDLKPANILVTVDGRVRLLDFGIAKLMAEGDETAEETELTRHAGRPLTPHYASPEQVAGAAVGTASDVYALGVVLFELLCGQRLVVDAAGAPRLSRQPISPEAAAARGSTPRALAAALAGDLETIVGKALKADPAERYPTAAALLDDLQRHADGLPVAARPDSAGYRLRKFVARHRLRVAAAAGAVLLLAGAAGVSLWQAREARAAAELARAESQRAQAVQDFLVDLFKANTVQQADPMRARQATARELLDTGAVRASEALASAPLAQEAVLEVLADLYYQLELNDQAARLREQRIGTLLRLLGPADTRVANAMLTFAGDVASTRERERGVTMIERVRELARTQPAIDEETRGWIDIETARYEQYLALGPMQRHADAALARFRSVPVRWKSLFHATQMVARARHLAGDQAGAVALNEEGIALARANAPEVPAWLKTPWVHEAEAQIEALQFEAAEQNLRRAWELARRQDGAGASVTLQTQAKLGGLLHATGRRAEGWRLLAEAEAALGQAQLRARPDAAEAVRRFAAIAHNLRGEPAAALKLLDEIVDDLRTHYPRPLSMARALLPRAEALAALGRIDEAETAVGEALLLWQGAAGDAAAPYLANRFHLQRVRLALARGDAALALRRLQALELPADGAAPVALEAATALTLRARAALLQGENAGAAADAEAALQRLRAPALAPWCPDAIAEAEAVLNSARSAGPPRPAPRPPVPPVPRG